MKLRHLLIASPLLVVLALGCSDTGSTTPPAVAPGSQAVKATTKVAPVGKKQNGGAISSLPLVD